VEVEPSSDDDQLYDLLATWDEQRRQGHEPTAELLCPDDEDLRERLRQKIDAQRRLDARLGLDESTRADHTSVVPERLPEIPEIEIEEEIGRGGMGVVYRGRQAALDRPVAVKVILGGGHAGASERARFRTEAVATARIPHPNIVAIHGSGEVNGLPYIVLEYLEGGSLAARLLGEPQSPGWSAALVRTLAGAVAAGHAKGVLHRDLKPKNIVFATDGTPKITDYGLSKLLDADSGLTATGQSPGTPSYMAPEQVGARGGSVGPATDVYALGAVLYELLVGRPPFRGATVLDTLDMVRSQDPVPPTQLQPKVPRDLETIVLKCLEKEMLGRYRSAETLADDLGRFLEGRPIRARRIGPLGVAWRWCKRHRALAAALLSVALVTLGGFAGITWQWREAKSNLRVAEQNLGLAQDAFSEFYNLYPSENESTPPDINALRNRYLTRGRTQLLNLAERFRGIPGARREYILALLRSARMIGETNDQDAARELSRQALQAAESWFQESSEDPERFKLLFAAYEQYLRYESLDAARCLAAYRRSEEVAKYWVRSHPDAEAGLRDGRLAHAFLAAVRLESLNRREESLSLFMKAGTLADLMERDLGSTLAIIQLVNVAKSYSRAGYVETERKNYDAAERYLRKSVNLFQRVCENAPLDIDAVLSHTIATQSLGNFLASHDRQVEAVEAYRAACDMLEGAVSRTGWREAERLWLRRSQVSAYNSLGLQHAKHQSRASDGAVVKAEVDSWLDISRKTHEIANALLTIAPGDSDTRYYDCVCCVNIYLILSDFDQYKDEVEARKWLERGNRLLAEDSQAIRERDPNLHELVRSDYEKVMSVGREQDVRP